VEAHRAIQPDGALANRVDDRDKARS
jgi:hypothetical protein